MNSYQRGDVNFLWERSKHTPPYLLIGYKQQDEIDSSLEVFYPQPIDGPKNYCSMMALKFKNCIIINVHFPYGDKYRCEESIANLINLYYPKYIIIIVGDFNKSISPKNSYDPRGIGAELDTDKLKHLPLCICSPGASTIVSNLTKDGQILSGNDLAVCSDNCRLIKMELVVDLMGANDDTQQVFKKAISIEGMVLFRGVSKK